MQLQNKKLLKVTAKEIKDRELRPNISFGIFNFSLREKELVELLTHFSYQYTILKKEREVIYEAQLDNTKILFFFHYNNRGFDYLSIHTNQLTLDYIELSDKTCDEIISIVNNYYKKRNIMFKYLYSEFEDEIFIDFEDIGLSVWFFQSGLVSDISVCK